MSKKSNLFWKFLSIVVLGIILWVYTFPWNLYNINIPYLSSEYKLGLDLQWGVELDYKVDLDEVKKEQDYDKTKEDSIIEGLKSIIDKRIQVLNINDSQITSATYGNEKHIIVQIPLKGTNSTENKENIKRAKEAIGRVVKIEFKEKRDKITEEDIQARATLANEALKEIKNSSFSLASNKFKDNYENVDTGTLTWTLSELKSYFSLPQEFKKEGLVDKVLTGSGKTSLTFEDGAIKESFGGLWYWIVNVNNITSSTGTWGNIYDIDYIFITQKPSDWKPAQDKKGRILNDKYFVKSSVQFNQAFQPMVELTFNDEWAEIFGELTRRLTGKQLAIFVGGQLLTAPNVNEAILTGKAVITGEYTPEEARMLSQNINTWVVPAPIYLTSERSIDSRLWIDSLSKLIVSGLIGFAIIALFLMFVYRASWVVASISLLLYILMVLAVVKFFGIILTLASIAGLILSVGMAIDANILIFERIKDELKEGEKMDNALKLGFEQSFSAIWDSNLTGLIVALILFIFGINLIKGFWLMLAIWIVVSLIVFYYISRVFVFLLAKIDMKQKNFIGLKK